MTRALSIPTNLRTLSGLTRKSQLVRKT